MFDCTYKLWISMTQHKQNLKTFFRVVCTYFSCLTLILVLEQSCCWWSLVNVWQLDGFMVRNIPAKMHNILWLVPPPPPPAKAVVNYLLQEKLSRWGRQAEQIGICLSESSNLMSIQVSLSFFMCKSLLLLQNIHCGISMKFVEQPCAF